MKISLITTLLLTSIFVYPIERTFAEEPLDSCIAGGAIGASATAIYFVFNGFSWRKAAIGSAIVGSSCLLLGSSLGVLRMDSTAVEIYEVTQPEDFAEAERLLIEAGVNFDEIMPKIAQERIRGNTSDINDLIEQVK